MKRFFPILIEKELFLPEEMDLVSQKPERTLAPLVLKLLVYSLIILLVEAIGLLPGVWIVAR